MPLQRILFFIFCTCISSKLLSQVSENVTEVNKCLGDILSYTAPAGASNINWSFGPYAGSQQASNQFALTSTGNFNAIFTGVVGGSPKSFTVLVKVHAKPVANFSITQPQNPCAVKNVTLTDQSTGSAAISSWYWIYGDGGANTFATGGSHVYGYSNIGNWSVTLIVTDANGCDAQKTIGTINVMASPTAVISPPTTVGCNSITVALSASNSIGSGLTYSWNFGNGQTSQQQNTSINFTPQATPYVVTLTVTSNNCSHVTTANVFATPPPTLSLTIPSTICLGAVPVATLQTDQPFSVWAIDNGSPFLIGTPSSSPPVLQLVQLSTLSVGMHTLSLSAGSQTCLSTLTKTIFVEQVNPSFSGTSPTVSCASPFIVSYNNTSSPPGTTASWSYKDADSILHTGNGNNPTFTLTLGSKNQYALFYRPFIPNISMTVTSVAGCTAVLTKTVHSLAKPTAWFVTQQKSEGCAPLALTFSNVSWVYPSGPIISYTWNNGAGGSTTGTLNLPPSSNSVVPNFNHTYNLPGVYHPSLTIETANNYTNVVNTCIDVSWQGTVTVVNPPVISFSVPSGPFCPHDVVQTTNTSGNLTLSQVQNWHVTSDNKRFSHCLTNPSPGWKFTHVGSHSLTLTGYYHSCAGTATAGPIVIKGPIVDGMFNTNCTKALRSTVDFTLDLQEVSQATLSFGDNTSYTVASNSGAVVRHMTAHTYSASGDYTAILTGVNSGSGCNPSIDTMVVQVRDANAQFVSPPTGCINVPLLLDASASTDVMSGCAMGYNWFVDNFPPVVTVNSTFTPVMNTPGFHTIKLFVKDLNSCVDSADLTVRISEVKPQFSLHSNSICLSSGTVQLTNSSLHTPDPLVMFNWNFGNFQTLSTPNMTVPIVQYTRGPVPDTVYTILLTAINNQGCAASVSHTLLVKRPPFAFDQSSNHFCVSMAAPTTVTFSPKISYPSYTINFGASASSTAVASGPSSYPYTQAGPYLVSIKVKDGEGCENTGTLSVLGIQTPTADFVFASPASTDGKNFCAGKPVTFTNVSLPEPTIPTWKFGSQSLGTNTNNIVSGNFSGGPATTLVAVGLTVTTGAPAYCVDSVSKTFNVYNYAADFAVSDTLVCLGSALTFTLLNDFGLAAYLWSYGDATSSSTLFPPNDPRTSTHTYPTYIPNTNGYVNAALVFWSTDMACREVKDTLVKVINVATDFKRNLELSSIDTAHCINLADKFQNLSTTNGTQLTYTWSFGDGMVSDSLSPYHLFTSAGVFQVTLTARESHNCMNSVSKNMIIYPLPTATILASPVGYCPGANFQVAMEGSPGVVSGTWTPQSSISGPTEFTTSTATHTVTAFAPETATLGLTVTSEFGCVSEGTDTTIQIIQPPKSYEWDTSVVIGELIQLPDYIPENVTFTWTPVFTNLSCTDCQNPVSNATVDIVYTVVMEDLGKCSEVSNNYTIHILPKSSIDVPSAFTPNGDGANDVIYVAGWGIKSLHHFRIYNRWGQLLFETDDINQGWDGNCKGVPQNTETYVYQVSVETFIDDVPLIKSGTFKLLR